MRFCKFLLVFIFTLISTISAEDKNFLWKVSKGNKSHFILGSIHAMSEKNYPLNINIMKAYRNSDIVAVEVDPSKMTKKVQILLLKESQYKNSETLSQNISSALFQRVVTKFRAYGYSKSAVNKMKPWWLMMLAAQFDLVKLGIDPNLGIDKYFTTEASKDGKRIAELEGMQSQLKMFFALSKDYPEQFVNFLFEGEGKQKEVFNRLVHYWTTGDLTGMNTFFSELVSNADLKPITQALIVDRNIEMTKKVVSYFNSTLTYFVIAGAGHFVGETGLVNALKQKGYTVEQVGK